MGANFAEKAKQIIATYGEDSGTTRKLLKDLNSKQEKFLKSTNPTPSAEIETNGVMPSYKSLSDKWGNMDDLPLNKRKILLDAWNNDHPAKRERAPIGYFEDGGSLKHDRLADGIKDERKEHKKTLTAINNREDKISINDLARFIAQDHLGMDKEYYDNEKAFGGSLPVWRSMNIPGRVMAQGGPVKGYAPGAVHNGTPKVYEDRMYNVQGGPNGSPSGGPEYTTQTSTGGGQYMDIIRKYFKEDQWNNAYNVMMGESGGNPRALRLAKDNPGGGDDSGLFQFNSKYNPEVYKGGDIFDPEYNIKSAADLYNQSGWSPWMAAKKLGLHAAGGPLDGKNFRDSRTTTDKWIESLVANAPQFSQSEDAFKSIGNLLGAPINYLSGSLEGDDAYAALLPMSSWGKTPLAIGSGESFLPTLTGNGLPAVKASGLPSLVNRNLPAVANASSEAAQTSGLIKSPNWRFSTLRGPAGTPREYIEDATIVGDNLAKTSKSVTKSGLGVSEDIAGIAAGLSAYDIISNLANKNNKIVQSGSGSNPLFEELPNIHRSTQDNPVMYDEKPVPNAAPRMSTRALEKLPLNGYIGDENQFYGDPEGKFNTKYTPKPIAGLQKQSLNFDQMIAQTLADVNGSKEDKYNQLLRLAPVLSNMIPGRRSAPISNDVTLPTVNTQQFSPDMIQTSPITQQIDSQYRSGVGELAGASGGSASAMRSGLQGLSRNSGSITSNALSDIYGKNTALRNSAAQYNIENTNKANVYNAESGAKQALSRKEIDLANKELSQGYTAETMKRMAAAMQALGMIGRENEQMKTISNMFPGYDKNGKKKRT